MPESPPPCDDDLILPAERLPADAVPIGVIRPDDSVIDFAPTSAAVN